MYTIIVNSSYSVQVTKMRPIHVQLCLRISQSFGVFVAPSLRGSCHHTYSGEILYKLTLRKTQISQVAKTLRACAQVSFETWRFSNPAGSSCLTVSFHFLNCKLSTNTNRGSIQLGKRVCCLSMFELKKLHTIWRFTLIFKSLSRQSMTTIINFSRAVLDFTSGHSGLQGLPPDFPLLAQMSNMSCLCAV